MHCFFFEVFIGLGWNAGVLGLILFGLRFLSAAVWGDFFFSQVNFSSGSSLLLLEMVFA